MVCGAIYRRRESQGYFEADLEKLVGEEKELILKIEENKGLRSQLRGIINIRIDADE
jgi:hypothetical protein